MSNRSCIGLNSQHYDTDWFIMVVPPVWCFSVATSTADMHCVKLPQQPSYPLYPTILSFCDLVANACLQYLPCTQSCRLSMKIRGQPVLGKACSSALGCTQSTSNSSNTTPSFVPSCRYRNARAALRALHLSCNQWLMIISLGVVRSAVVAWNCACTAWQTCQGIQAQSHFLPRCTSVWNRTRRSCLTAAIHGRQRGERMHLSF